MIGLFRVESKSIMNSSTHQTFPTSKKYTYKISVSLFKTNVFYEVSFFKNVRPSLHSIRYEFSQN